MAAARINIFENIPSLQFIASNVVSVGGKHNILQIHHVYIPGSLSFNNVIMGDRIAAGTISYFISFGLYSLNGSTLSLANSAVNSITRSAVNQSLLTFATSATQDITPGDWFFGIIRSFSATNEGNIRFYENSTIASMNAGAMGGPFMRGFLSVSTDALPASIATSDMSKEGTGGAGGLHSYPYILISA